MLSISILPFYYIKDKISLKEIKNLFRNSLATILILSFIVMIVHPSWVISDYSEGLFRFRYNGLVGHANTMAPIAAIFLILNYNSSKNKKVYDLALDILSIFTLIICQSKTTALALLVSLIFVVSIKYYVTAKTNRILLNIAYSSIMIFGSWFLFNNGEIFLDKIVNENSDLTTFTGRTFLWNYAEDVGRDNIIFGYGSDFLDPQYNGNLGFFDWAPHAHNQFVDTFARFGIYNAIFLAIIYIFGFVISIRFSKRDSGIGLGIFVILAIRSISEVPLFILYPNDIMLTTIATILYVDKLATKSLEGNDGE